MAFFNPSFPVVPAKTGTTGNDALSRGPSPGFHRPRLATRVSCVIGKRLAELGPGLSRFSNGWARIRRRRLRASARGDGLRPGHRDHPENWNAAVDVVRNPLLLPPAECEACHLKPGRNRRNRDHAPADCPSRDFALGSSASQDARASPAPEARTARKPSMRRGGGQQPVLRSRRPRRNRETGDVDRWSDCFSVSRNFPESDVFIIR